MSSELIQKNYLALVIHLINATIIAANLSRIQPDAIGAWVASLKHVPTSRSDTTSRFTGTCPSQARKSSSVQVLLKSKTHLLMNLFRLCG
jgi:hypothetical protein